VRIPSGDLAPARRSRRRRRRALPVVLVLAAVAAVGGGAYALRRDDSGAKDRLTGAATPCATTQATAAATAAKANPPAPPAPLVLPPPGKVSFRLLNGTPRDGLGRNLGDLLAARGFKVKSTGNAPKPLAGPSRVYYGPGAKPAAQALAIHVIGAELAPVGSAPRGAVDLVIGTSFARLRTPAEVTEFTKRVLAGTAPTRAAAPAPTPTASGCA
jgi:hypothetical protein